MTSTLKDIFTQEKLASISFKDVIEGFVEGKTYQDLLEIPEDAMQAMFERAMRYFDEAHFDEAADCFLFLAVLNPMVSNLWIRSGNAEQALERYEEALEAYSMAMLCDADDPFPHYYSAEIYLELQCYQEAKECLSICLHLINEHEIFLSLKEPVLKLQEKVRMAI